MQSPDSPPHHSTWPMFLVPLSVHWPERACFGKSIIENTSTSMCMDGTLSLRADKTAELQCMLTTLWPNGCLIGKVPSGWTKRNFPGTFQLWWLQLSWWEGSPWGDVWSRQGPHQMSDALNTELLMKRGTVILPLEKTRPPLLTWRLGLATWALNAAKCLCARGTEWCRLKSYPSSPGQAGQMQWRESWEPFSLAFSLPQNA